MWWRQRAPSSPPKTSLALLQLAGQVGQQRANLYCDSLSLVASDTAELGIVDEAQATRLDVPEGMSVSSTLGVFGGTGLTAYFGLTRVRPAFATRCASFSQAHALLRSALCAMARAFSSPRPPERPDRWSRRSRSACTPFAHRGFGSAQDTPSIVWHCAGTAAESSASPVAQRSADGSKRWSASMRRSITSRALVGASCALGSSR